MWVKEVNVKSHLSLTRRACFPDVSFYIKTLSVSLGTEIIVIVMVVG